MNQASKTSQLFRILLTISILAFVSACQDDPYEDPGAGDGVITPKTRALINLVQLNDFPDFSPAGTTWDDTISAALDTFGLADISTNISVAGDPSVVLWSQGTHFSNVTASDTLPYYLTKTYEVIPFGSTIDVNIYDYELPDSTFMGKVSFVIDQYPDPDNPWPSYVTANENGYSVTIGITWLE